MDQRKKSHAIAALRRSTYKWRGRWMAEKRSHVGRGEYLCESCGLIDKKKEMQMDHIVPVVDPSAGWQGFDSFVDRVLVEETGWQRLCKACHSIKTKEENLVRKETAKKMPKKKKNVDN